MKETSMETPSYDIETEKMMVCYERDSFFKRDFTDHRTDHRFFCGQFFIWDTECQTVRKDHTGHESGHEPPSGSRYLGGLPLKVQMLQEKGQINANFSFSFD